MIVNVVVNLEDGSTITIDDRQLSLKSDRKVWELGPQSVRFVCALHEICRQCDILFKKHEQ